jgi:hypothetical protein
MMRKTAVALVPTWEDSYKAYNLVEHVQEAIDAFPDHTFTGRLDCEGDENTDLWRVVVRDGRPRRSPRASSGPTRTVASENPLRR